MQMLSAPAVALQACWRDEDTFFAAVGDWEALPIETRRPFGFYYAHLAAFSKLKLFPEVSYGWIRNETRVSCLHR